MILISAADTRVILLCAAATCGGARRGEDEVTLLIIGQMRDIDLSSPGNIGGEGREYCRASFVWKDDCVERRNLPALPR